MENQQPDIPLLTCMNCELTFTNSDAQRTHMKSDFHRWNMSRMVAGLPSVTIDAFDEHMAKKKAEEEADEAKRKKKEGRGSRRIPCEYCHRSFNSEKSHELHLRTKHGVGVVEDEEEEEEDSGVGVGFGPSTQTEEPKEDSEDIQVTMTLTDCLFCRHKSRSLPKNLAHMTHEHSFFIPDIEYLVDLPGLLRYLAAKLELGNICLWCNGRGKGFSSLEGVRNHMMDASHCKLDFEENEGEYDPFYDFSSSYPDPEHVEGEGEGDWEDMSWNGDDDDEDEDEEEFKKKLSKQGVATVTDAGELQLPDGRILGYREYLRTYKQRVRGESSVSRLVRGLNREYTALGWKEQHGSGAGGAGGKQLATTTGALHYKVGRSRQEHIGHLEQKKWQKWALSVGRSANKLQKFIRLQL